MPSDLFREKTKASVFGISKKSHPKATSDIFAHLKSEKIFENRPIPVSSLVIPEISLFSVLARVKLFSLLGAEKVQKYLLLKHLRIISRLKLRSR